MAAFEQGGFEEIGDEQARLQYGEGDPGRNGVFRHVPQNQRSSRAIMEKAMSEAKAVLEMIDEMPSSI